MKRNTFLIRFFTYTILCCFIFSNSIIFVGAENAKDCTYTLLEEKVFSSATLDDDFYNDSIIVVLNNEASLKLHNYDNNDFPEINSKRVLDLTLQKGQKIKELLSTSETNSFSMQKLEGEKIIENYNQILCIDLKQKGKEEVLYAISALRTRSDVIYVGPNYKVYPCDTSSNNSYFEQWAHEKIQIEQAWDIEEGTSNIIVGIIDSGIDGSHSYLNGSISESLCRDFTVDNSIITSPTDTDGHGTNIAGIIASNDLFNLGVSGICKNVQLASLKVIDESGEGRLSNVINAITYAESQNIPILNYSMITEKNIGDNNVALYQAIENYSGLFVCAAGNWGYDNDTKNLIPTNYNLPNLISVAASNEDDERACWGNESSCYGKTTVDIFAPGNRIITTNPNDGFSYKNGTSMATAFVTGTAALIMSAHPNATPHETKQAILNNTDTCSEFTNLCVSNGRLNAFKALGSDIIHNFSYTNNVGAGNHIVNCTECGWTHTEPHTFSTKQYSNHQHIAKCVDCNYSYYENHTWNPLKTKCLSCGFIIEGSVWTLKKATKRLPINKKRINTKNQQINIQKRGNLPLFL